jgi:2-dehydropantoate 2-reductase
MNAAGLNTTATSDVMATIWTKVAFNCVLNPLCTLLHVPVGALAGYAEMSELVDVIVGEVVKVAASDGARIDQESIVHSIEAQYDPAVAKDHLPSMLVDELLGRPTEIAYLNGAVVQIGERHGVDAPTNRLIFQLVRLLEATRPDRVTNIADLRR